MLIREDRINPNFNFLKSRYIDIDEEKLRKGEKKKRGGIRAALLHVLCICEAVFRSIASWLPTCQRKDSHGKKYAIPLELDPSKFSLLSCLSNKTKVQIEHMDDSLRGHMYWAQVAARDRKSASTSTCFPWAAYHRLYPSWRILSQGRRVYV
jgi:hypothetical protein